MTARRPHIAALLVLALLLPGCAYFQPQATPLQKWAQSVELYNATLNNLVTLDKAGRFTEEQKAELYRWRVVADAALGAMEGTATGGKGEGFDDALAAFDAALDRMIEARLKAERKQP